MLLKGKIFLNRLQKSMGNNDPISRFDMSCAQAHWVRSKPIGLLRVMQLKLHKRTTAIGYSLRMCARHVDSTNPGRSNLVFRSKPIPEAEMSNRLSLFVFRLNEQFQLHRRRLWGQPGHVPPQ